MGKIVAIGGGEINKRETLAIDQEIIKLSDKKNPKSYGPWIIGWFVMSTLSLREI